MAKPKLDLYSKSDAELKQFAATHEAKMLDNPAFPNPAPPDAEFTNAEEDFSKSVDDVEEAKVAYETAISRKNQSREALTNLLTQRGAYVSHASKGDPTLILSSGFELSDTNRSPLDLTAPVNLSVSQGDGSGKADLMWDAPPRSRAHIIECRINDESLPWQQAAVSTKSRVTIQNLQSGQTYAFRVRSIGAKGDSPWSTATVKLIA